MVLQLHSWQICEDSTEAVLHGRFVRNGKLVYYVWTN